MLHLVLADRHQVRLIQQDVGRLKHRIVEQAGDDALLPRALSLNCVCRSSSPSGVTVLNIQASSVCSGTIDCTNSVHVAGSSPAASSDNAISRVRCAQVGRLVRHGDRVVVDDAEERLVLVLQLDPVLHRSEIVSDVQLARGLDAAEDSWTSGEVND